MRKSSIEFFILFLQEIMKVNTEKNLNNAVYPATCWVYSFLDGARCIPKTSCDYDRGR